jgi:hypothetical protein
MTHSIPDEWQCHPPEAIVAGDGSYTTVLAGVLGAAVLPLDGLHAGPEPNPDGGYPRVLDSLKRVFLVVQEDMSATDALRCHRAVWDWVEKLSSAKVEQNLAFIFVLPEHAAMDYEDALAVGLSVPAIDAATTGHAVWRRSGTLPELINLVAAIQPQDLVRLLARRKNDGKRLALGKLRIAAAQDDPVATRAAAQAVLDAFHLAKVHLDLFCRPPEHAHGHCLRRWLDACVTDPVTPDWCETGRTQLAVWLDD